MTGITPVGLVSDLKFAQMSLLSIERDLTRAIDGTGGYTEFSPEAVRYVAGRVENTMATLQASLDKLQYLIDVYEIVGR